ncbi:ADP-ribosylglycohydrolase family protein [Rugosimonospora africana]|uniref:ADP-ribosylglycohydrolase n=1 Tax=Rugosimonospora africana TaxID=556532 RepID=A0A8J3QVX5_9ACTN|nr:ADP-ribosylglycohydrolase family protein [Rugosimonospora africana]GIH18079.1 ADP-ribosylglycohydrolase [Rugosimonospora africana]
MTEGANRAVVSRRDRVAGGLLGVHAGDALGATVEFSSWASIRSRYPDGVTDIVGGGPFGWPPGHATDDTDLTRAVLLAYLAPGEDVVRAAADNMLAWLSGDWPGREPGSRPSDVGGATATGLQRYRLTGDPRDAGAGTGRAGNGSLMRCISTGLVVTDEDRRIRESMEISAITHDDPRATVSCAAYNEMAAALLAGAGPDEAVEHGRAVATRLGVPAVADAIAYGRQLRPAMLALTGQTFLADDAAGFVLDSLSLAVAAVLDARPLPDVLVDIVRIGNDTDTNAAIAGGLLGVRDGAAALPDRWLAVLQFGAEFTEAARRLTAG